MPIYWDGLLITWNATKPHDLTITLVVVMVLLVTDLEWQLKNCIRTNICLWEYSLREKIIQSLDEDFTRVS